MALSATAGSISGWRKIVPDLTCGQTGEGAAAFCMSASPSGLRILYTITNLFEDMGQSRRMPNAFGETGNAVSAGSSQLGSAISRPGESQRIPGLAITRSASRILRYQRLDRAAFNKQNAFSACSNRRTGYRSEMVGYQAHAAHKVISYQPHSTWLGESHDCLDHHPKRPTNIHRPLRSFAILQLALSESRAALI
jgi:hypothetical protein